VEAYLIKAAEREGLRMAPSDHVPNTRLAMSMAELARDKGGPAHHETHVALFAAHFADGRDIGSRDVLLRIAEEVGLPAEDVQAVWREDRYAERLDGFHHVALSLGVDAVPAALVCNRLLIGSRPYKVLEDQLEECLLTPGKAERSAAGTVQDDPKDAKTAE